MSAFVIWVVVQLKCYLIVTDSYESESLRLRACAQSATRPEEAKFTGQFTMCFVKFKLNFHDKILDVLYEKVKNLAQKF